jgi:hypothetical protein
MAELLKKKVEQPILFCVKIFSAICFYVWKAIVSPYFTKI